MAGKDAAQVLDCASCCASTTLLWVCHHARRDTPLHCVICHSISSGRFRTCEAPSNGQPHLSFLLQSSVAVCGHLSFIQRWSSLFDTVAIAVFTAVVPVVISQIVARLSGQFVLFRNRIVRNSVCKMLWLLCLHLPPPTTTALTHTSTLGLFCNCTMCKRCPWTRVFSSLSGC